MTWIIRILTFVAGFGALVGVLYLVATAYGWDKIWAISVGPADQGPVQFEGLKKRKSPNQALICPDSLCSDADRDMVSPQYTIPALQLREALLTSLEKEQRLERVDGDDEPLRLRFVQRTKTMRYPDTINVQFFEIDDKTSTMALYGRSQIGTSDFGVNLARLKRWLRRLDALQQN